MEQTRIGWIIQDSRQIFPIEARLTSRRIQVVQCSWTVLLDGHRLERIVELCATFAAHTIASPTQCEHATKAAVTTASEEKYECSFDNWHNP
jgi:hypothetical protein